MTTFYPVQQSTIGPPQFTATLDGNPYIVTVVWSLFGQRYYVNCFDLSGNLQFSRPLIESLPGLTISTLAFDELTGLVLGTTDQPHGYKIGSTTQLTISGASPDIYNGTFLVFAAGPSSFSFPLSVSSDPGAATAAGVLSYIISIAAGYFNSTLVYRQGQFEVSP